jgi:hypothetical protein
VSRPGVVQVMVSAGELARLRSYADQRGLSLSAAFRLLVLQALDAGDFDARVRSVVREELAAHVLGAVTG